MMHSTMPYRSRPAAERIAIVAPAHGWCMGSVAPVPIAIDAVAPGIIFLPGRSLTVDSR